MAHLKGGTFKMGDLSGQGSSFERPAHFVSIKPFYIGIYPVTTAQWMACVEDHACPSSGRSRDPKEWAGGSKPVTTVSMRDVGIYIEWLSQKTKARFRLPTEAEYEYAARANTKTEYWWGDNGDSSYATIDERHVAAVGARQRNPFGLFDMVGNVLEWTADCWHDSYEGAPADGGAWKDSGDCNGQVVRGGSKLAHPHYWTVRSADRADSDGSTRSSIIGFRLVQSDQ
jgi:formylglycine-generating enzyme required for sulfatase activity